jgi:hypothetical protein
VIEASQQQRVGWSVRSDRSPGRNKVLQYVGRYTHRVTISNNRLISMNDGKLRFRWKDYQDANRQKTMMLETGKFIRRLLIPVDHRIRPRHALSVGTS